MTEKAIFTCPVCGEEDTIVGHLTVVYSRVPLMPDGYVADNGQQEWDELDEVRCTMCGTQLCIVGWQPPELKVHEPPPSAPDWQELVKRGCPHCGAGADGSQYTIGLSVTETDIGYKAWVNPERRRIMHAELDDEGILRSDDGEPGIEEITEVTCLECLETIWKASEEPHPRQSRTGLSCYCCQCDAQFTLGVYSTGSHEVVSDSFYQEGPYCPICGAQPGQIVAEKGEKREVTFIPEHPSWQETLKDDGCPQCGSRDFDVHETELICRDIYLGEDGEVDWGDHDHRTDGDTVEVVCSRCRETVWKRSEPITALLPMTVLRSAFRTAVESCELFGEMGSEACYDRLRFIVAWLEEVLQALGEDTRALRVEAVSRDFSPYARQRD